MADPSATRGFGLLEGFLARKRATKANSLIPQDYRGGRVLDIGAGSYPVFLLTTTFSEKVGIDQTFSDRIQANFADRSLTLVHHEISSGRALPFGDEYFDVITMLAVFEHIAPEVLPNIFQEVYRVLRHKGLLVITTPAEWTAFILNGMAKSRLVSNVEISDHKRLYAAESIATVLRQTGFSRENIRYGYFELHMNRWLTAIK